MGASVSKPQVVSYISYTLLLYFTSILLNKNQLQKDKSLPEKHHSSVSDSSTLPVHPVWGTEQFRPRTKDGGFRSWHEKGIQRVRGFYMDGMLITFNQLHEKYQILSKHFLKYLSIKVSRHLDPDRLYTSC